MTEFDTGDFAVDFYAAMRAAQKHYTMAGAALTVCGETGEMVEALRRYVGMARRPGSIEELAAELADVEIAGFMFAAVCSDVPSLRRHLNHLGTDSAGWDLTREEAALLVAAEAGHFAEAFLNSTAPDAYGHLALLVSRNRRLAGLLGVDLPAAIEAKAAVIMSRGFGAMTEVPA